MLLGTINRLCPPFLCLGDEHISMMNMFITNGMCFPFCIFMSSPEVPICISGVSSFPMQSVCCNIFSRPFRCGKLALKMDKKFTF